MSFFKKLTSLHWVNPTLYNRYTFQRSTSKIWRPFCNRALTSLGISTNRIKVDQTKWKEIVQSDQQPKWINTKTLSADDHEKQSIALPNDVIIMLKKKFGYGPANKMMQIFTNLVKSPENAKERGSIVSTREYDIWPLLLEYCISPQDIILRKCDTSYNLALDLYHDTNSRIVGNLKQGKIADVVDFNWLVEAIFTILHSKLTFYGPDTISDEFTLTYLRAKILPIMHQCPNDKKEDAFQAFLSELVFQDNDKTILHRGKNYNEWPLSDAHVLFSREFNSKQEWRDKYY